MQFPAIRGLIRRRLLVNYRVDAEVMRRYLPAPFRPKLHKGFAIAGICLIRLEQIRPNWLPASVGFSSENAAHRIAVVWKDDGEQEREGVFVPRRDTSSLLNHLAGGRIFPGEHGHADITVRDADGRLSMSIRARDGGMNVELRGQESDGWPSSSCFKSLAEASAFFEGGSLGYSVTRDCGRLDGIRLKIDQWRVQPLAIERVESSFFADRSIFPDGSVSFDHALLMRDIEHRWQGAPPMQIAPASG